MGGLGDNVGLSRAGLGVIPYEQASWKDLRIGKVEARGR